MTKIGLYAVIGFLMILVLATGGCYFYAWYLKRQDTQKAKMKLREARLNLGRWQGNYATFIKKMDVTR